MASRVAWMCAWVALSVAGCGKAEGGPEPIPLKELPARVANLLCDSLAGCCKSSGLAIDTAACKTYYTVELQSDFNEDVQPRVRYDAQAAGDCLSAVSSQIECGQVEGDDDPACDRIFVGTVALGQPCNSSRECAAVAGRSVYCESQEGLTSSVCTAGSNSTLAHGKAGSTCNTTCYEGEGCGPVATPVPQPGVGDVPAPQPQPVGCYRADGLFCDVGVCAPLVALGAPCGSYEACTGTAFCNFNTGLCTAPQPDGSSCEGNSQCASRNCGFVGSNVNEPGVPQVCSPADSVTAEQCGRDFTDSTDSTSPSPGATDPGTSAGAP